MPDLLRLERIFADDQTRQPGRGRVGERTFDDAFRAERVGIDFADSGDARVGCDLYDQRVLSAVALDLYLLLTNIDRFDAGYLHTSRDYTQSV